MKTGIAAIKEVVSILCTEFNWPSYYVNYYKTFRTVKIDGKRENNADHFRQLGYRVKIRASSNVEGAWYTSIRIKKDPV